MHLSSAAVIINPPQLWSVHFNAFYNPVKFFHRTPRSQDGPVLRAALRGGSSGRNGAAFANFIFSNGH